MDKIIDPTRSKRDRGYVTTLAGVRLPPTCDRALTRSLPPEQEPRMSTFLATRLNVSQSVTSIFESVGHRNNTLVGSGFGRVTAEVKAKGVYEEKWRREGERNRQIR